MRVYTHVCAFLVPYTPHQIKKRELEYNTAGIPLCEFFSEYRDFLKGVIEICLESYRKK